MALPDLIDAVYMNNLNRVNQLLATGADPNVRDPNTRSPVLVWAVESKNIRIVQALLEAGADPNLDSRLGSRYTALMVASMEGYLDIIKLLLEKGADPNIRNYFGNTALVEAANYNHKEIVKLLLPKMNNDNLQHIMSMARRNDFIPSINKLILDYVKQFNSRFNAEVALQLRPGLEPKTKEGAQDLGPFAMNYHLVNPILNFAYPKYPKNGGRRRHRKTKKRASRRRAAKSHKRRA
jgi:ankyrin repeat protein